MRYNPPVSLTPVQSQALDAILREYAEDEHGGDMAASARDGLNAAAYYDDHEELYYPDQPYMEGLFNLLDGFGTARDWRVVEQADDDGLRRYLEVLAYGLPEPRPVWGIPTRRDNLKAMKRRLIR